MEMNRDLQGYFENIFTEISENCSDSDTLEIGIELIKIATTRLDSDLHDKDVLETYNRLIEIIKELESISKKY